MCPFSFLILIPLPTHHIPKGIIHICEALGGEHTTQENACHKEKCENVLQEAKSYPGKLFLKCRATTHILYMIGLQTLLTQVKSIYRARIQIHVRIRTYTKEKR